MRVGLGARGAVRGAVEGRGVGKACLVVPSFRDLQPLDVRELDVRRRVSGVEHICA